MPHNVTAEKASRSCDRDVHQFFLTLRGRRRNPFKAKRIPRNPRPEARHIAHQSAHLGQNLLCLLHGGVFLSWLAVSSGLGLSLSSPWTGRKLPRPIGQSGTAQSFSPSRRQATTLLKFAKTISDPKVAAGLVEKAADLKSKGDERPDPSPRAPDIECST